MTDSRFQFTNGKRLVLIVDDEAINREILKDILKDQYEPILAESGISSPFSPLG